MPLLTRLKTSLYRAYYRNMCRQRYRIATCRGCEFVLWPENYVDRRIWIEGVYERRQIDMILKLAAEHKPSRFFDVGANVGLYSAIIGRNSDIPAIHAFECDPRNLAFLNAHLYMNGLQARAQVHPYAVGNCAGTVTLHMAAATSTGKSSIVAPATDGSQPLDVAQKALDDEFTLAGETLLFKIDVEGYEQSALAGMRRLLTANRCLMQIEILPGAGRDETFTLLDGLGYKRIGQIDHDYYYKNF